MQPAIAVLAAVNVTVPALPVFAAVAAVIPRVATLDGASAPIAMPDMNLLILHIRLLGVSYLALRLRLSVALKGSLSLEQTVVELIEKDPVTLRVPVVPTNLPVPLMTVALPVTATEMGAAWSVAQPLEVVVNFN